MQYKIVDYTQGSQQWKNWRKGKIGGSMVPTIMGENPYETPLQLFERLIADKEIEDNRDMQRGRELEPLIRDHVNQQTGRIYKPACVESLDNPWMIASLDGWDDLAPVPVLEIKSPRKLHGEVPVMYYGQLQHAMFVTGSEKAAYQEGNEKEKGPLFIVERDDVYCKKMIKATKEFWERLLEFNPPAPTDKDFQKVENPALELLAQQLKSIKDQMEDLKSHEEALRENIIGQLTHVRCKVGPLTIQKVVSKGRINYSAIPELKNINLEAYRSAPIESWRVK